MATQASDALARPFRLFAVDRRVLAQNADGKLVDIGEIRETPPHGYIVRLDVDGLQSEPQASPERALAAVKRLLTFDYLDGLFTSEAPAHVDGLLEAHPHVNFTLDEPLPGNLEADDRPHRF